MYRYTNGFRNPDPTHFVNSCNQWTTLLETRVVTADFKHEHNHRHTALGYRTPPNTLRQVGTDSGGLPNQQNQTNTRS